MTDPTRNQRLIDIAAGDERKTGSISPEEAHHIARYRQVADLAGRAAEWTPPAATLAAAKAIFRPAAAPATSLGERLHQLVARLVVDSRTQPLAVRSATTGAEVHLAYEGDGFEIDLSFEPRDADGRIRLRGQIDSDAATTPTQVVCRRANGTDDDGTAVTCDERGRFEVRLLPGRYELRAAHGDRELLVPDLDLT